MDDNTHDEVRKDVVLDKVQVSHNEEALREADRQITPWQCLRQNPKIALWTLYANIGTTLVGYENLALSVCLAMPAFQKTMASEVNGQLIIPAYWQSAWNGMYNAMMFFGSFTAGYVQDWCGRRAVLAMGILIASTGIAISFVAQNPAQFLGGKIVTGFSVGLFTTTTQTYVSEIAPLPIRGIALSVNTIMLNLGLLIAIASSFSRTSIMDESAFRVVFAAAWAFPGILAIGLPFLPESPTWLVIKNKHDKARRALQRLSGSHEDIDARLAQIVENVEAERQIAAEGATFIECFKGTNWRRTRIILACFYIPQVVGAVLSSNAPYFLNQTGLDSHTVLMLVQIGIAMGVVSAVGNAFLMMRFRHRPLMFSGITFCVALYFVMGVAAAVPRTHASLLTIGVALIFTSVSYGPAVGASMAVAGEVSASRLRAKSLGVGVAFSSFVSVIWTIILPYLFNADQLNLGGHIGWIFFVMGVLMLLVIYFDIPGTKGRTFEELDIMFELGISARKFEKYEFNEGPVDTK
ncbi:maltose permease [Colletotrichum truncatum]|uniref:Maltose permease n=1 Tax=Colletotrichum truncatum TaxID=5467 RepID=A0ACC3YLP4_COLTU|nr:maltose permease [Colletotrichum truncatum]KAF6791428.1 maltose permease [Colletotrichum truncatum]